MSREKSPWVKVYSDTDPFKIGVIKSLLSEQGIQSQEINKKDSLVVALGEIELYVREEDRIMASLIIYNQSR
jgi:hypothetical protein